MASIILNSVGIEFPIYHLSARSIKKQFLRLGTGGKLSKSAGNLVTVKALSNLTFSLQHGDRVGIIGHNGAGKSTLLRVLSQIYEPTSGNIQINGKVSPLLDIMFGIDPESTGYENITMRGILLGLSAQEIKSKMQDIAEFTGLGDYLAVPIRTYSLGMQLRLAFAVATSILPEILILDEVVGAGDNDFFQKARQRLQSLILQSSIVVIATHTLSMIEEICNKVLVLDAGQLIYFGPVKEGLEIYNKHDQVQTS